MKLNEKYEEYLLTKANEEGGKDFRRYANKVFKEIEKDPNITKRKIRQLTRKFPINYKSYLDFIDTSMIVAPIVNYVTQPEDVRKSKVTRGIKAQIRGLTKNAKLDITKPKNTVDKVYSIVGDMKRKDGFGTKFKNKGSAQRDFSAFLNSVAPDRESILKEARDRLSANTKSFKKTLTGDMYKDYQDYLKAGYGKPDAIQKMLSDNRIKNDHRIKRYLETEAHEDYEKAKVAHAKENGYKYKYWRTQRDVSVRDSHRKLDGKIVKHDEHFNVGGHKALYPGDTNLPLKERINCRCSTEFAFVPRGTRKGANIPQKPKPPDLNYPDLPPDHPLNQQEFNPLPSMRENYLEKEAEYYLYKQIKAKDDVGGVSGTTGKISDNNVTTTEFGEYLKTDKGLKYNTQIEKDGITYNLEFGPIKGRPYGVRITSPQLKGVRADEFFGSQEVYEVPYHDSDPGYYIKNELGEFKIADFEGNYSSIQDYLTGEKMGYTPLTTRYGKDYKNDFTEKNKPDLKNQPNSLKLFDLHEKNHLLEQVERERVRNFYNNTDEEDREIMDYTKVALERTFEKNDFAMRLPLAVENDNGANDNYKNILNGLFGERSDGRFKSIHETGFGFGASDEDYRTTVGENLWGYNADVMDKKDFEKYGYLSDYDIEREINTDVEVNAYGETIVRFKKDRLADRTTFTVGDSFTHHSVTQNRAYDLPQRVVDINPQFIAVNGETEGGDKRLLYERIIQSNSASDELDNDDLDNPNKGIVNLTDFQKRIYYGNNFSLSAPQYVELQYHGDLTLADVQDITVDIQISNPSKKKSALNKYDTVEEALLTEHTEKIVNPYNPKISTGTDDNFIYENRNDMRPEAWEKLAANSKKYGFDLYATQREYGTDIDKFPFQERERVNGQSQVVARYRKKRIKLDPDKLLEKSRKRRELVDDMIIQDL